MSTAPGTTGRRSRPTRLTLAAVSTSALAVLAGLVVVTELDIRPGTLEAVYAEWFALPRDRALLLILVATLGACTLLAAWNDLDRHRDRVSQTAVATAVLAAAWAALPVALWFDGARWVDGAFGRGAALAVAALAPVALVHVVHSVGALRSDPAAPLTRPAARATAYVLVVGLVVVHLLAYDPFLDPRCVLRCEPQSPPLASAALAQAADTALRATAVVAGATTVLIGIRLVTRSRTASVRPVGLAAVPAGLAEIVWTLSPTSAAVVGPAPFDRSVVLVARLIAHIVLSLAALVVLARFAQRRRQLRRMAREIVSVTPPGSVREIVATRLDDPRARTEYAVGSGSLWVDESGRPVPTPAGADQQQVAVVSRGGHSIARIRFATGDARAADLEDALGPAAVLALEAERTHAELLLRLRALRSLRRRVVEESDHARRRAERDLHDGAQHLLLAATFAIQEALQDARATGNPAVCRRLDTALADVSAIAADLRAVAHGMYPVLLGDAGLVPALEGLARSGASPVSVDSDAVGRVHPSVELTVYEVCSTAVRVTEPCAMAISLHRGNGGLRLRLAGAALPHPSLEPLRDRVAALGGTMETMTGSVAVDIPCG